MSFGDRRRFPRESCLIKAQLRHRGRLLSGTILNLSERGLYIAALERIGPGIGLELQFKHPRTGALVIARATVTREVGPGSMEGAQPGFAIELVDSLSDLEDRDVEQEIGPEPSETDMLATLEAALDLGDLDNDSSEDDLDPDDPLGLLTEERKGISLSLDQPKTPLRKPRGRRSGDTGWHPGINASGTHRAPDPRLRTPDLAVIYEGRGVQSGVGRLKDASMTGLFVACRALPATHRTLRIKLQSPDASDKRPISLTAKVAWLGRAETRQRPQGFGLRILNFPDRDDRRRFQRFIATLKPAEDD